MTTLNQKCLGVHRLAHLLWIGPIPEGYHVDHVLARGCVHHDCFNPAHLEAVTPAENQARIPRPSEPSTHCQHGHAFTVENTLYSNGRRWCRACGRRRQRDRRKRLSTVKT